MTIQGPEGADRMRLKKRAVKFISAFAVAVLCAYTPSTSQAGVILEVTGASTAGHTIKDGEAALTSFSLSQAFANVTITADLFCFNCSGGFGGVYLANAIGNTAGIVNLIDAVDFGSLTFNGPDTVIFTGLNLPIDEYFLVVFNDTVTIGGFVFWNGSTPPRSRHNRPRRDAHP